MQVQMNTPGGKRKDILHTKDTIIQQILLLFTAPSYTKANERFLFVGGIDERHIFSLSVSLLHVLVEECEPFSLAALVSSALLSSSLPSSMIEAFCCSSLTLRNSS